MLFGVDLCGEGGSIEGLQGHFLFLGDCEYFGESSSADEFADVVENIEVLGDAELLQLVGPLVGDLGE